METVMIRVAVVLTFLWSLVHCQTFPYVSFMDQSIADHSYVNLVEVGNKDNMTNVWCHTDLSTCCSASQGYHRGDWYFPNGTRLNFSGIINERRGAQIVLLRRNSSSTSYGIYRCDVPTNTVHHKTNINVRASVHLGLYSGSEGISRENLVV